MGFESERVAGVDHDRGVVIDMNDVQLRTLGVLQANLNGSATMDFTVTAEERDSSLFRSAIRRRSPAFRLAGSWAPENSVTV
jgi:hypothetical protein